jgi:hypothetical protein
MLESLCCLGAKKPILTSVPFLPSQYDEPMDRMLVLVLSRWHRSHLVVLGLSHAIVSP